jgi:hypothetical protein
MTRWLSSRLLFRISQCLYIIAHIKTYTVKTVPTVSFWFKCPFVDLADEERLETYENNLLKH